MFKVKSGFSILEMIMVVAIVAILATWFLINAKPTKRLGEAADAQRQYDVESIEKAIKLVAADNGVLSSSITSLTNNQPYAIVQAGASTVGTYTCTATGSAINKVDISGAIASIMPSLPVDPDLTDNSNDTGYYIVRNNNSYNIETCDSYYLAATIGNKQMCGDGYCGNTESCSSCNADCGSCGAVCGNFLIEGAEVCDDGNTSVETQTCGNSIWEHGDHCNANCTAVITLTESCDDGAEVCGDGIKQNGTFCNDTCSGNVSRTETCDYIDLDCPSGTAGSDVGCATRPYCNSLCSACLTSCPAS